MFHPTSLPAQVACRLTPRRRLAVGGLLMTSALTASVLLAVPAHADESAPVTVTDAAQLETALQSGGPVRLGDAITTGDLATVTGSTSIDLNGHELQVGQLVVADHADFTLTDTSTEEGPAALRVEQVEAYDDGGDSTGGTSSTPALSPAPSQSTTPPPSFTAVLLQGDATFHVDGARVEAYGAHGGAGIGSEGPDGGASFAADGGATVSTEGGSLDGVPDADGDSIPTDGGAGIGGADGRPGIAVSIDHATVIAIGGAGAAGIGGGSGGDGGTLHLGARTTVSATQGAVYGDPVYKPSSIGAGQGDDVQFGRLSLDQDAYLGVDGYAPLVLPASTTPAIENAGRISLDTTVGPALEGTGTIHNLGSITAYARTYGSDGNQAYQDLDPTTATGDVQVTGYNYALSLDGNGGTISGATATSGHVMSDDLSDLAGGYSVAAPDDASTFWKWNTAADGSGTDVAGPAARTSDVLSTLPKSTGTPLAVRLFARFAKLPSVTATDLPDAIVGTPYRAVLPVTGDGLNDFEVYSSTDPENPFPGLPAGLTLDTATGVISGTPTEAVERDVYFSASNVGVSGIPFTLHIAVGGAPVFGTTALPDATAGTAYATTLVVSGGTATYRVIEGALPAGLQLDATSGGITGSPIAGGSASFTVRATNRFGSADRAFTLAIAAAAAQGPAPVSAPAPAQAQAPVQTAVPAADPVKPVLIALPRTKVDFGHAVTLAVTAQSTLPVSFAITGGALPRGVRLNAATGLISGAAAESGTYTAEITATSSAGSASTSVVIAVSEVQELLKTKGSVPAVKAGAGSVPVEIAGLKKGERWTVRVDGKVVDQGRMKKTGALSVQVHLKKAKKDTVHTIRIAGSRAVADPSKTASTTFTVTSLSAKKTLEVHAVSANGTKLVAVEKLAAGERVIVKDGKKVIAKGHASAFGIFAFPQSKAGKGTSRLTVHGATAKRAGKLTVHNAGH